jgi:hypothetical protein
MKRVFGIAFVFVFAAAMLTGFGCALTNYSLITDNDVGGTVNTAGNSYVKQSVQVATTYPDGSDNLIWFVNQKTNGDRNLSTINFFTTGSASLFKDDLYCSPDWNGCAVSNSDDPQVGDVDNYDYTANPHCSGYRSLSLLVSSSRYYGECGRVASTGRSTRMISLANNMTPVQIGAATWLRANLNASNTSLVLNNQNGSSYAVPMTGSATATANFALRRLVVDMSNPMLRNVAQNAINWSNSHPGALNATLSVYGTDIPLHTKLTNNAASWTQVHY